MALQTATKLTYDDYVNLPDDGKRYEIIDGVLYVNPSPNTKHQRVLGNLYAALRSYAYSRKTGEVFIAPFDVVFSHFDILQPDILYIRKERLAILTEANVRGAPDIVIEVLSKGTRRKDGTTKRKRYELFGVSEYWIADPVNDTVRILKLEGEHFERIIVGGRTTSSLLPGFSMRLKDVFAAPRF